MVGCAEPTVVTGGGDTPSGGLPGLVDQPRPASPSPLPEALRDRGARAGAGPDRAAHGAAVTPWSSRLLAEWPAAEGHRIPHVTIARIWHGLGYSPGGRAPSRSPPIRSWRARSRRGRAVSA